MATTKWNGYEGKLMRFKCGHRIRYALVEHDNEYGVDFWKKELFPDHALHEVRCWYTELMCIEPVIATPDGDFTLSEFKKGLKV